MHEMGIAMQVAEIATAALKESVPETGEDIRVEQVNLRIGKLSSVIPESLRFCFGIITQDTVLAGAKLKIEEIPVVARCKDCQAQWTINGPVFKCEKCQSGSLEILSGQELEIVSLEIAD
ncbi:MAG: hydrogenase maturation nickel metallochaperone HypA [Desulfococcaceae bacterium]